MVGPSSCSTMRAMRSPLEEASILALAVSSWLLPACGPAAPAHPTAFDRRASFDLNCPWQQIDFVPISERAPRTYGAVGCGKRATYVETCQSRMWGGTDYGGPCSFVLDSAIQVDRPAASGAAAVQTHADPSQGSR